MLGFENTLGAIKMIEKIKFNAGLRAWSTFTVQGKADRKLYPFCFKKQNLSFYSHLPGPVSDQVLINHAHKEQELRQVLSYFLSAINIIV